ncbi:2726_t:CDS:2, partial [Acaulospora colombiana]
AVIMLLVYIASRIYAINPPGDDNALDMYAAGGHDAFRHEEEKLAKEQPKLSPLFCFGLLIVLVVLIGFTAEWLVESIEFVREKGGITEERSFTVMPTHTFLLMPGPSISVSSSLSSGPLYWLSSAGELEGLFPFSLVSDAKTNWVEGFTMLYWRGSTPRTFQGHSLAWAHLNPSYPVVDMANRMLNQPALANIIK